MERFQKLAVAALASLIVLIAAGAVVRSSGAGLGCPDWPTCWGSLVPPWKVEQVDLEKLDLEKFKRKAQQLGRDPSTITRESLKAEFNPVHTWIEYVNRLLATPLALLTLATFVASFRQWRRGRPAVFVAAAVSLVVVLVNAWLGALVVYSGLKPGIITLHMVLAIVLMCLLVFVAWRGTSQPLRRNLAGRRGRLLWACGLGLFLLVVAEGVMGSQVRELTDRFAMEFGAEARSVWTERLEHSSAYLVHRSFSWLIVAATLVFLALARKELRGGLRWPELWIGGLVLALFVMGVVLSRVGVLRVVQVLHVLAAALLVAALFFWLLATRPART